MSRPSGILLAGGASRRFGRSKIIEPLKGVPLFHWPLRALLGSCEDVVIVLGTDTTEPPLPDGTDGVSFVRDGVAYEGPLAGTRVGLEHVRGKHAVVLAADMPGVSAELLTLMALRAARTKGKAIVLRDTIGPRPLPAVLRVAPALALALKLLEAGERRLRALVEGLEADVLAEAIWTEVDGQGAWRDDVNEPGDLPMRGL